MRDEGSKIGLLTVACVLLVFAPAPCHAQGAAALAPALQKMEEGLLRNMPVTARCRIEIALTCPTDRGGSGEVGQLPAIQLLWKSPARIKLSFLDRRTAPSAPPAADDLSTTATAGSYFEDQMERFFTRLRKLNRLASSATAGPTQVNEMMTDPLELFLMALRADASATFLGPSTLAEKPVLGMDFPRVMGTLPLGISANHLKIWIGERGGLPARIRAFTQRQGILTFDFFYAPCKDKSGLQYVLPSLITAQPSLDEDGPSAAFPVRIRFADYDLNREMSDADLQ